MPGLPYVAKLPDGRPMAVELPEDSAYVDPKTNELILKGPALRFLDRVQTLLAPLPTVRMSPARHRILREILELAPGELATAVGRTEDAVLAWESGSSSADAEALGLLERLRAKAAKRGIAMPALAS
jgi:DNA-binding transcriptional regulator YiaG